MLVIYTFCIMMVISGIGGEWYLKPKEEAAETSVMIRDADNILDFNDNIIRRTNGNRNSRKRLLRNKGNTNEGKIVHNVEHMLNGASGVMSLTHNKVHNHRGSGNDYINQPTYIDRRVQSASNKANRFRLCLMNVNQEYCVGEDNF